MVEERRSGADCQAGQSFVSMVSLFCQRTGLALALQDYTDKKTGEMAHL